jgi:glycosyltransferase involved in cell wall biosynthesis
MKIAIIADPVDNQNAGIHSFTINMIRSLIIHRGEHEIIIIKTKRKKIFDSCREIVIPNIKLPTGFASLRLFFVIPVLLRILKADAVIEPTHFGPFNLPNSMVRVTIIHDLTALLMPEYHRWHSQFLQRIFLPGILRKTDLIPTNSQHTTNDVQKMFPEVANKVKTILLGRDPSFIRDLSDTELRNYNIRQPFFHYLGTIEPRKDLNTLLKAYQILRDLNTGVKPQLILAGAKGWKTKDFFRELKRHPYQKDIRLLGRVSQKMAIQLHSRSLALIYPSLYEGFGLPVLECLSCGGRVIAANNSSLPEVGGPLTEYFTTGDPTSLAEKMLQYIQKPLPEDFPDQARLWTGRFSWDNYALTLIQSIENVHCDKKHPK